MSLKNGAVATTTSLHNIIMMMMFSSQEDKDKDCCAESSADMKSQVLVTFFKKFGKTKLISVIFLAPESNLNELLQLDRKTDRRTYKSLV